MQMSSAQQNWKGGVTCERAVDEQWKISGINDRTACTGYGTKGCGTFIKENKRGRDRNIDDSSC